MQRQPEFPACGSISGKEESSGSLLVSVFVVIAKVPSGRQLVVTIFVIRVPSGRKIVRADEAVFASSKGSQVGDSVGLISIILSGGL